MQSSIAASPLSVHDLSEELRVLREELTDARRTIAQQSHELNELRQKQPTNQAATDVSDSTPESPTSVVVDDSSDSTRSSSQWFLHKVAPPRRSPNASDYYGDDDKTPRKPVDPPSSNSKTGIEIQVLETAMQEQVSSLTFADSIQDSETSFSLSTCTTEPPKLPSGSASSILGQIERNRKTRKARARLQRRPTPLPTTPEKRWEEESQETEDAAATSDTSRQDRTPVADNAENTTAVSSQENIAKALKKKNPPAEETRHRSTTNGWDSVLTESITSTTSNSKSSSSASSSRISRQSTGNSMEGMSIKAPSRPPRTPTRPAPSPANLAFSVLPPKRIESPLADLHTDAPSPILNASIGAASFQPAVRGLPREDSISDHSDISSHHPNVAMAFHATLEVRQRRMYDAHKERGLYTGSMDRKTFLPDGFGTMRYDSKGKEYTGDWKQGVYHGHGRFTIAEADEVYDGPFHEGLKHGPDATMKVGNRLSFHGRYHKGQMRDGLLQWPQDKSSYQRLLKANKRHGFGLYTFPNGDHYEGQWENDKMHGRGRMEWKSDGTCYNGDWEGGVPHGTGTESRADGSIVHQGEFYYGKPAYPCEIDY